MSVSDSGCLRLIAESGELKLFPVPPVSKSFKSSKSDYCANVVRKVSLYAFISLFWQVTMYFVKRVYQLKTDALRKQICSSRYPLTMKSIQLLTEPARLPCVLCINCISNGKVAGI